jgi:hypothetical protein
MNDKNEFEDMVAVMDTDEGLEADVQDERKVYTDADPEWSEYVLDNMHDTELREGNPTVDGLRRVTEKVYGEILESRSDVLELPSAGGRRCTIKHTLKIRKYETDATITVDGCVDVRYDKVPFPFNDHLVATADTRAEGKALRRALKLRVVTAEEMDNSAEDDVMAAEENITDQQILAINQMCKRLNINIVNFVKEICAGVESIKAVSNLQGRMLLSSLSEYQRKADTIKDELIGYDPNWRKSFDSGGKKK